MKKLETFMVKKGGRSGVYITFPSTRKEIRKRLRSIGIVKNEWETVAVKTGSNVFADAVVACKNLDELNYLGYWMSQFSEEEYHAFFELCNAGCSEGNSIAGYINVAANIKNYFRLDGIRNETDLGRRMVGEYLRKRGDNVLDVWKAVDEDFEEIGLRYTVEKHGHYFEGNFYGRTDNWERVYNGEDDDIPEDLLIDSIRI